MANVEDQRQSGNRVAERFDPASDWTQDAMGNYLFVDLPGFKKEELRLELASTGHMIISGERVLNDNKSIYFKKSFPLPENADIDKIKGNFDGDFLHVTVPTKSVTAVEQQEQEENKPQPNENAANTNIPNIQNSGNEEAGHDHEQSHDSKEKGDISKGNRPVLSSIIPLEMAMEFLKKNKGVVISVVVAFSIGMLLCRTFE